MAKMRRAVITFLLIRPVRRWLTRRFREAALDYIQETVLGRPQAALQAAQAALPTSLPTRLALLSSEQAAEIEAEAIAEESRRATLRTVAIIGVVVASAITLAVIIAAAVRARREAEEAGDVGGEAVVVPVIVPTERDELRDIRGIGPETAARLRNAGVGSLEQIAAWTPEDVARVAAAIDTTSERIEIEDWIGQAKDAAAAESVDAATA